MQFVLRPLPQLEPLSTRGRFAFKLVSLITHISQVSWSFHFPPSQSGDSISRLRVPGACLPLADSDTRSRVLAVRPDIPRQSPKSPVNWEARRGWREEREGDPGQFGFAG